MSVFCVFYKYLLLGIFKKEKDANDYAIKERLAIVQGKRHPDYEPQEVTVEAWNLQ